jgi:altronate hydrolase
MNPVLHIHDLDTVAVALRDCPAGLEITVAGRTVRLGSAIARGHKIALIDHPGGMPVLKYGHPIGLAKEPIPAGAHVHVHNLVSALTPVSDLGFTPLTAPAGAPLTGSWSGWRRGDGRCATRNELWIIPTVGCVARTAQALAEAFRPHLARFPNLDGVQAFSHPFGCSQLGDDLGSTRNLLAALAMHPNAGGVLILGLGCENNKLDELMVLLAGRDPATVRSLGAQDSPDEHREGLALLEELAVRANADARSELPISALAIGLKCGGSDGLSGITANPLLGRFATRLTAAGGQAVLTEVPEMFGAESALLPRCTDPTVFAAAVRLIDGFRTYYQDHHQPVDANPSPGNHAGGISTLAEKSLGCVQKGGAAAITDVLAYGGRIRRPGLTLLEAPGNDQVSVTALAAACLLYTSPSPRDH